MQEARSTVDGGSTEHLSYMEMGVWQVIPSANNR